MIQTIQTEGLFILEDKIEKYSPISLEYFLNMELANGGGGKEIIKFTMYLFTINLMYLKI